MNIWADVVSGSVAGLISGLLISFALWAINHFNKPIFEYFHVGGNTGHFYYNRLRPIIIGGSFVTCHGPALFERSPRGGGGGFYFGPKSHQVFSTGANQGELSPGESIEITYQYVPLRRLIDSKTKQSAYHHEMDPLDLFQKKSELKQLREAGNRPNREDSKLVRGWRSAFVVLTPSATK